MQKERETFGSRAAVVMAMAGSAIGLGNIWRFPYIVGEGGGAAFIIVYLLSSLFLSLPIFLSETIIGRRTGSGTFGAMTKLAPGTKWKWMGMLTIFSSLTILSYYSVVGGWSIDYLYKSVTLSFIGRTGQQVSEMFGSFISSVWGPILCHTLFLSLTALIVVGGVKNGIEKFAKITMPLLFVLMVLIMIFAWTLPGSGAGISYMLKPDFSRLDAHAIASAMGQSFFSLSLGVGTILTYASYIDKKENLLSSGLGTASFDLLFALIAGFAVMPAVFSAGIAPGNGPGLVFETLPYIFSSMSSTMPVLSYVVAIFFFTAILVAALTSSISMLQVGVAYLVEEKHFTRVKAIALLFALTWSVGVLCSLSFGPLSSVKIIGLSIFEFCDKLTSNFLMAIGGMLFTLFAGWKMGKNEVRDEFTNGGTLKFNSLCFDFVYFMIRYVAPIVIAVIFVTNLAG